MCRTIPRTWRSSATSLEMVPTIPSDVTYSSQRRRYNHGRYCATRNKKTKFGGPAFRIRLFYWRLQTRDCFDSGYVCVEPAACSLVLPVRHKPCVSCGPWVRRLKCAISSVCIMQSRTPTDRRTERATGPRRRPVVTVGSTCQPDTVFLLRQHI